MRSNTRLGSAFFMAVAIIALMTVTPSAQLETTRAGLVLAW